MGGLGSGRWFRPRERVTTQDLPQIDIRSMKKQGVLYPNYPGAFCWTLDDPLSGPMNFEIHRGSLKVEYFTDCDSQTIKLVEKIEFDSTPCHLGGERYWFLCPCCKTRVTTLFRLRDVYRCRYCHNLPYRAQNESELDRLIRKSRKLRRRLGGTGSLYEPVRQKPKGMHHSTFDQLSSNERTISLAAVKAITDKTQFFEEMGWLD
ncbi:MAG: hypothetical protein ABW139_02810 [Candidatus Thiodiazotropha sp. DIVDIV]